MALVSEAARAKINLTLHVLRRREDGFHLIESLVVFADVADRLNAGFAPQFTLDITGPFAGDLAPGEDNIVLEAARAVAHGIGGVPPGAELMLEKNLPVASGIGGGSADAAATLRLLSRLWTGGSERGLEGIAARLGADTPMCLLSVPLRAQGIGDRLTPISGVPAIPLVLVNPGVPVVTAQVFKNLARWDNRPLPEIPRAFKSVFELAIWLRQTWNGLDAAARAEAKVINRVLEALAADPDCLLARMTGSGPTCFGMFASPGAAHRAAVRLRVGRPEWWIAACVTGAS